MTNGSEGAEGGGYGTRLHLTLRALAGLVGTLEPDRYSGSDARRLTELFAWGERLCATGKALAAKRVADTGAWKATGERSAADWLGQVSGQTAGQAAGALETAKRMGHQPDVEKAARSGALSEQQSAAVAGAAAKDPDKTDELLEQARGDNLAALRERARQIKLAADEKAEKDWYRRIHAGRYLRSWTDDEGAGRLSGRFTPDALASIRAALQPFQEEVFDAARRVGSRERRECHTADALVAMAAAASRPETGINADRGDAKPDIDEPDIDEPHIDEPHVDGPDVDETGRDATGPGEPNGGPDATPGAPSGGGAPSGTGPTRPRPPAGTGPSHPDAPSGTEARTIPGRPGAGVGRRPALVIVRIDHAALVRGFRRADECCEIDGIGPVPVATVRAMMTDAFLAAIVTDGVNIRSVVHLGRAVTAAQRTAMVARDRECVVPGCHVNYGLEIDHVEGWAPTRITTVDSLARICRHHHHQKTYEGWQLRGTPGQWQWIPPPDRRDGGTDGGRETSRAEGPAPAPNGSPPPPPSPPRRANPGAAAPGSLFPLDDDPAPP
jgi:hypothetical protein